MGRDSAASTQDCRQRFRRIIDRTLPVVSFASGKRLMGSIAIQYGAGDIEDLYLDLDIRNCGPSISMPSTSGPRPATTWPYRVWPHG
jgi:hypothetical protein